MSDDYIPSQIILDYYSDPVNYGPLSKPDIKITGHNKGCTDTVTIYLQLNKDKIKKITFQHSGCVISKAGGCIATEVVMGKTIKEVLLLKPETIIENLGGVLKTRVSCAYLTINLIKKALLDFSKNKKTFPVTYVFEI